MGIKMKRKEKIAAGLAVFFVLMWICTLVSKSIYASKLPRVNTVNPEKRRIEHLVEAEGIVKQGSDVAVHTLPGMRVMKICVRVGDEVEEGSELFWLDTDDLGELIEEKKLEAAKLEYQIEDLKENRALEGIEKQKEISRAREDLEVTADKADTALERADEALDQAGEKLNRLDGKKPSATSDGDRKKANEEYEQWVKQGEQLAATVSGNQVSVAEKEKHLEKVKGEGNAEEIKKAEEELKAAAEALEAAEDRYENYQSNPKSRPDFSDEDSARKAWESEKEILEDNVRNAQYGREDALTGNADSLRNAERALEDAGMPERSDSTLEIYQMQLERLQKEIERYREIYQAGGKVASDRLGTVTKVNLTVGERTVDGAAVVCADNEVPYQFETLIAKEQKKYVNQGDTVTLSTPEGKSELEINYLEEDASGAYRAVVYLPQGKGTLGMSGTLNKAEVTESYECCVPVDALHKEGMGERYYIYLVGERDGILGRERYVEMRYVKVLDMNDSYAALENGSVSKEEEVIIGSNKEVENNMVVRMED
ncbi:MAG: hypothetical protein HFI01_08520 [Lachnospiraceae bacterium]|jgi:hypothetical protein|nr:hypothetical protein [Lachnospiraceae bacterium]MCI9109551.1 hypothetical protein [Lachnospiraceae bacterium]MCI9343003.1 hypothetical protein [Lachnospiraceae bacterium]